MLGDAAIMPSQSVFVHTGWPKDGPSTRYSTASGRQDTALKRSHCAGHKFIGAPVPCGVVITRARYIERLSTNVEYLNSRDATIMGSRNGHAPIYMWYTLTRKGYEGMRKDVERCLRNAHLLKVGPGASVLPAFAERLLPAWDWCWLLGAWRWW